MMNPKCSICPLKEKEVACRGQNHVHFCNLVNPASPIYKPEFIPLLALDEDPSTYPSIVQQAHSLWRDIKAFVRSGGKLAPKALRVARLAKCEEPCEKWDAQQRRCMVCGCAEDAKVYLLVAECPLDKWDRSI
jgi:hypothetical protein